MVGYGYWFVGGGTDNYGVFILSWISTARRSGLAAVQ